MSGIFEETSEKGTSETEIAYFEKGSSETEIPYFEKGSSETEIPYSEKGSPETETDTSETSETVISFLKEDSILDRYVDKMGQTDKSFIKLV